MSTEPEKGYWQKPENYVSLATLFAVLTYTGVQIAQTWMISDNNVVSQRAFVYFAPNDQPKLSGESTSPKGVILTAELRNSGNTPTKNLTFFYKCAPSAEDLLEPWTILYQGKEKPNYVPNFIGGHAAISIACSFSWEQMEQMAAHKLFGYVMMEATYWDRLDDKKKHVTQVVLKLNDVFVQAAKTKPLVTATSDVNVTGTVPQINVAPLIISFALTNVGSHNCADEECSSAADHR